MVLHRVKRCFPQSFPHPVEKWEFFNDLNMHHSLSMWRCEDEMAAGTPPAFPGGEGGTKTTVFEPDTFSCSI